MTCPNDDPNFTKTLKNWVDPTPQVRQNLFYMVCIPARFILYYLVYLYRDYKYMPLIVSIFSIFTMVHLYPDLETGKQWWSKKWDFWLSAFLVFMCIGVAYGIVDSRMMAGVLYLSLAGGIAQSLSVKFC